MSSYESCETDVEPTSTADQRTTRSDANAYRYDPSHLPNTLHATLKLKNYAALPRKLGLSPPVISKIRHRQIPVSASVLIRIHEVAELSIAVLRGLMGDRRKQYWIGSQSSRRQQHADRHG